VAREGVGGKIVVTLYYFSKVPCLNFNHVIIMKDFHNISRIMISQNPEKPNAKNKNKNSYDVMLNYISKNIISS